MGLRTGFTGQASRMRRACERKLGLGAKTAPADTDAPLRMPG